jgi:hypothetical protein
MCARAPHGATKNISATKHIAKVPETPPFRFVQTAKSAILHTNFLLLRYGN